MLKIIDACVCVLCSVASVMSDSLPPCGLWPARLLCPWNFSGQNTGVGCQAEALGKPQLMPTENQQFWHWEGLYKSLILKSSFN